MPGIRHVLFENPCLVSTLQGAEPSKPHQSAKAVTERTSHVEKRLLNRTLSQGRANYVALVSGIFGAEDA